MLTLGAREWGFERRKRGSEFWNAEFSGQNINLFTGLRMQRINEYVIIIADGFGIGRSNSAKFNKSVCIYRQLIK